MSLYRNYRPKTFADVVGQNAIVQTLTEAEKQGSISHAYLFSGPRGTGKTSTARILARTLLLKDVEDPEMRKLIEQGLDDGSLVDLIEIDAASNRGIDDIRNLIEKLQFSPVLAKTKVHIVDEVHMLTREAFNALLKTLEEPPPYAYFILATTELHKVPLTIQSRCQRFQFGQIPEEDILSRLQFVAEKEGIKADTAALSRIAVHVQGGMRDALSLLDQLSSLPHITVEAVEERIGESGHELVQEMLKALETQNASALLTLVERAEERALPAEHLARMLLAETRKALHATIAKNASTNMLLARMDALLDCLKDLRSAPLPAFTLESALLSLLEKDTKSLPILETAPERPRVVPPPVQATAPKKEPIIEPVAVAPVSTPAPTSAVETPSAPASADLSIQAIRSEWIEFLKLVEPASVRMSLKDASLRELDGNTVVMAFSSNFHREKVANIEASRAVEELLTKHFHSPLRIRCVLDTETKTVPQDREMVNLAEAAADIF